jgi:hypothetical protein
VTARVFDELRSAVHTAHAPKVVRARRQRRSRTGPVPDITFRWRSESLAPPPRSPAPRRSPG